MSSDDHYSVAPLYSILTARDNDLAISIYERHQQMSFQIKVLQLNACDLRGMVYLELYRLYPVVKKVIKRFDIAVARFVLCTDIGYYRLRGDISPLRR